MVKRFITRIKEWLLLLVMEATCQQFLQVRQEIVEAEIRGCEFYIKREEKQKFWVSNQLVDLMQDIRKCVEEGPTADLKQHITDTLDRHYGAVKDAAANHAHETLNATKSKLRMRCDYCNKESWHFHTGMSIDSAVGKFVECNDCRIKRLG